jgi:hypothetical protein
MEPRRRSGSLAWVPGSSPGDDGDGSPVRSAGPGRVVVVLLAGQASPSTVTFSILDPRSSPDTAPPPPSYASSLRSQAPLASPIKGEVGAGGWGWRVPWARCGTPTKGCAGGWWLGQDRCPELDRHLPLDGGGWEGVGGTLRSVGLLARRCFLARELRDCRCVVGTGRRPTAGSCIPRTPPQPPRRGEGARR